MPALRPAGGVFVALLLLALAGPEPAQAQERADSVAALRAAVERVTAAIPPEMESLCLVAAADDIGRTDQAVMARDPALPDPIPLERELLDEVVAPVGRQLGIPTSAGCRDGTGSTPWVRISALTLTFLDPGLADVVLEVAFSWHGSFARRCIAESAPDGGWTVPEGGCRPPGGRVPGTGPFPD